MDIWNSVISVQISCKPKTALKISLLIKKKPADNDERKALGSLDILGLHIRHQNQRGKANIGELIPLFQLGL